MSRREQLRASLAEAAQAQPRALIRLCLDALDFGLYDEIARQIEPRVETDLAGDKLAWQVLGLARRGLQDSAAAHAAFERAAGLAPNEPLVTHSLARTALEAGYPAVAAFTRARRLAPNDASVLQGQAAALLAAGEGEQACRGLALTLAANPGWFEGHRTYARISAVSRPDADRYATLRQALERHPADGSLWRCLIEAAMQADDYAGARTFIDQARPAIGNDPELTRAEAICRNECGDPAGAWGIFAQLGEPRSAGELAHILRCLLRLGRFDEADQRAAQRFAGDEDLAIWPYRALIWRVLDDPRWHWLEGDPRLIGVYDVGSAVKSLPALAEVLRGIHRDKGAPIDQSVRGGTQTDGNLLARAEPEIRDLRAALLDAARAHVAQLPPPSEGHPTLLAQRQPIRIEGAWSVRLSGAGFHVDHVHPQGWFSSAFYAALPEGDAGIDRHGASEAGWLTFGECRALLPELAAFRTIEPRVGQLALFPSTLWHGTRRFGAGERMSVALDIQRPPQD